MGLWFLSVYYANGRLSIKSLYDAFSIIYVYANGCKNIQLVLIFSMVLSTISKEVFMHIIIQKEKTDEDFFAKLDAMKSERTRKRIQENAGKSADELFRMAMAKLLA